CLGMQHREDGGNDNFTRQLHEVCDHLAKSRPTAVNLFWALDRMRAVDQRVAKQLCGEIIREFLLEEAKKIHEEDRAMCHAIGRFGAELIAENSGVLTHCNAGGLATAEYGTALSVFFT